MIIDAFKKQCPLPLMMAKKQIDAGVHELDIRVDNDTAVKNLTRLGKKSGLSVQVEDIEGGYLVSFFPGETKKTEASLPAESFTAQASIPSGGAGSGYAVFIGKDYVGEGSQELGYNLMKMALYTLSESDVAPTSILFMNSGVQLLTNGEQQIIENIKVLIEKGSEVLVCGTCLDYYQVKDKLAVGEISNMYDILERMQEAAKVISL